MIVEEDLEISQRFRDMGLTYTNSMTGPTRRVPVTPTSRRRREQNSLATPSAHRRTLATSRLNRPPRYTAKAKPRVRPEKLSDRIVRQRGYQSLTRAAEHVAVVEYRPTACQRSYRLMIVRQTIAVEKGQARLFHEIRCRFYPTNDRQGTPRELMFKGNDRRNGR